MKKYLKLFIFVLVFIAGLFIIKISSFAWYTGNVLIIYYQYEDETTAYERYYKEFSAIEDYYVESPEIKGYTPDKAVIEGTFRESVAYWVTYYPNEYNLTINYLDEDGYQMDDSYSATLKYNENYEIESPTILGFEPDIEIVSGTMEDDLIINVIYHKLYLHLTIYYVDENGNNLIEPSTYTFDYFERYEIETPEIKGYYADENNITGTLEANDVDVIIVYHQRPSTIIAERVMIILTSFLGEDNIVVNVFYEIFRRIITR